MSELKKIMNFTSPFIPLGVPTVVYRYMYMYFKYFDLILRTPSHLEDIGDLPSEELFIFWKYGIFHGSCKILIYPLTLILSLVGTPIQAAFFSFFFGDLSH